MLQQKISKISVKVLKISAIVLAVLLILFTGFQLFFSIYFKPHDVRLTNVTDTSFTISWITNSPMRGIVYYKNQDNILPGVLSWIGAKKAHDDRDVADAETDCVEKFNKESKVGDGFVLDTSKYGCNNAKVKKVGKFFVHHVTLTDLDENTEYSFRIGDGVFSRKMDINKSATFPSIKGEVKTPSPIFGKIINNEGTSVNDSIVYIKFINKFLEKESIYYSTPTSADGSWYLDGNNIRTINGDTMIVEQGQDIIKVYAQYENYTLSEPNDWVYGDTNIAYPDIVVSDAWEKDLALYEDSNVGLIKSVEAAGRKERERGGGSKGRSAGTGSKGSSKSGSGGTGGSKGSSKSGSGGTGGSKVSHKAGSTGGSSSHTTSSTTSRTIRQLSTAVSKPSTTLRIEKNIRGQISNTLNQLSVVTSGIEKRTTHPRTTLSTEAVRKSSKDKDFAEYNKRRQTSNSEKTNTQPTNTLTTQPRGTLTKNVNYQYNLGSFSEKNLDAACKTHSSESCRNAINAAGAKNALMYLANRDNRYIDLDMLKEYGFGNTTQQAAANLAAISGRPMSANNFVTAKAKGVEYYLAPNGNFTMYNTTQGGVKRPHGHINKLSKRQAVLQVGSLGVLPEAAQQIRIFKEFKDEITSLKPGILENTINYVTRQLPLTNSVIKNYNTGYATADTFRKLVNAKRTHIQDSFTGGDISLTTTDETDKNVTLSYDNVEHKLIMNEEANKEVDILVTPQLRNTFPELVTVNDDYISSQDFKILLENTNNVLASIDRMAKTENVKGESDDVLGTTDVVKNVKTLGKGYITYLPEYGFFDVEIPGLSSAEKIEGETFNIFYIEVNGKEGLQIPNNPEKPQEGEDIMLKTSSMDITYKKTAETMSINIKKGVNLISFSHIPKLENEEVQKASDLLKWAVKNGIDMENFSYFSDGRWKGIGYVDGEVAGEDFTITPGRGYLAYSKTSGKLSLPSYQITSSVPISLSAGWNLVGIHGYKDMYTAKSLIESINKIDGLTANNISWWPTSKGKYEGLQLVDGRQYGSDFSISTNQGYFIRISKYEPKDKTCKSLLWNENGPKHGVCAKTVSL